MERDIQNFNNGLGVDEAVDALAKEKSDGLVKQLFAEAQNAEFLVPYREKDTEICIFSIPEKGKMIPAFSSYEAFLKSPLPKDNVTVMPFSKINEILRRNSGGISGVIINPHGKSLIFKRTPEEKPGEAGEQKHEIKFMKPGLIPEAITAALTGFFTASQNVYRAYLLWAQKDNDLAPHLFLIIDFDGEREEFFPKVAEVIRPYIKSRESVEMAKASLKLISTAEKLVNPFYKK